MIEILVFVEKVIGVIDSVEVVVECVFVEVIEVVMLVLWLVMFDVFLFEVVLFLVMVLMLLVIVVLDGDLLMWIYDVLIILVVEVVFFDNNEVVLENDFEVVSYVVISFLV